MRIEVKLYGDLKRYAPGDGHHFSMRLDPGATAGRVSEMLDIPNGDHVTLVNGRRTGRDEALSDGDILVFMPHVSGG